jgi:subtilisin family serine protease
MIMPDVNPTPPQHALGIYDIRITGPAGTVLYLFAENSVLFGFRIAMKDRDGHDLPLPQTIAGSASPIAPIHLSTEGTIDTDSAARNIITVAAYDDTNGDTTDVHHHALARFSSRGPLRDFTNPPLGPLWEKPDIAAPGVSIDAALSNESEGSLIHLLDYDFQQGNRFVAWQGTSMATPIIAGVIALMFQKKKDLSITDVRSILTSPANVREGFNPVFGTPGYNNAYGAGMVDALKAHTGT